MQRYFLTQPFDEQALAIILGEDRKHIVNVMRMNEGDQIICVSDNAAFICDIKTISAETVVVKRTGTSLPHNELPIQTTIVCGLAKGDKHELIVQKATELGVSEVILFKASRSIVKWDEKKGAKKIERLQKIAQQAAEQCHRTKIPVIREAVTLKQLLEVAKSYDVCLFADEEDAKSEQPHRFAHAVKSMKPGQKVLAVFGPEGGLSREEATAFSGEGFSPIALGPRILRTETAPLYLLSALSYEFE